MKITKVIGYALSSPYGDGKVLGQPLGVKSIGFVEVHTDAGLVGIGETYAGVYSPELIAPVVEFIAARLVGRPADPAQALEAASVPFVSRNGLYCSVYSAVDIALWDIAGQAAGKPVHALLGTSVRESVRMYASGGSAAFDPTQVADDASAALDAGHEAFKMRVGLKAWGEDLDRVASARERLGSRTLMVDAIMGTIRPAWKAETALARIRELEPFRLEWIEEPLHPNDVEGMREVRSLSPVSVAAGEALTGELDYSAYLALQAVDIIQVDVTHCGGLSVAMGIVENAHRRGLKVAMHVWGSAVAHAANAHLAFAHPAVEWLEAPMVSFELSRSMADPLCVAGGATRAPDYPGLGVDLPEAVKNRYPLVAGSGYRL